VGVHDRFRNGEAEAAATVRPASRFLGPREAIERARGGLGTHARALVVDADDRGVGKSGERHHGRRPGRRVHANVAEQVGERLAELSLVTVITSSARVITAAALIMVSVFGAFVLGNDPVIKMFGIGLSVAVLLDATIVRMVIVPAVMTLLDKAAWWLPRWLDRTLPNLDVEGERLLLGLEAHDLADPWSGTHDPDAAWADLS
jgi:hypothetical protein